MRQLWLNCRLFKVWKWPDRRSNHWPQPTVSEAGALITRPPERSGFRKKICWSLWSIRSRPRDTTLMATRTIIRDVWGIRSIICIGNQKFFDVYFKIFLFYYFILFIFQISIWLIFFISYLFVYLFLIFLMFLFSSVQREERVVQTFPA